jgi:hypothetical protein
VCLISLSIVRGGGDKTRIEFPGLDNASLSKMQDLARVQLNERILKAVETGLITARWSYAAPYSVELVQTDTNEVIGSWSTDFPPPPPPTTTITNASTVAEPAVSKCNSDTLDDSSELIQTIARVLAPQAVSASVLQALVASDISSTSWSKDAIRVAIRAHTVSGGGAMVDLTPRLAALVQPEWYAAASEKKRAANRVARLLHKCGLPFKQWLDLIDKDVFLDLHSRGGIMSGMASSSAEQGDNQNEATEYDRGEAVGNEGHGGEQEPQRKRRRVDRLKDFDNIDWERGGDVSQLLRPSPPPWMVELEAALKVHEAARAKRGDLPVLVIRRSSADIQSLRNGIRRMADGVCALEKQLMLHEGICSELKHELQLQLSVAATASPPIISLPLIKEVERWLKPQLEDREHLVDILHRARLELSLSIREDADATYLESLL